MADSGCLLSRWGVILRELRVLKERFRPSPLFCKSFSYSGSQGSKALKKPKCAQNCAQPSVLPAAVHLLAYTRVPLSNGLGLKRGNFSTREITHERNVPAQETQWRILPFPYRVRQNGKLEDPQPTGSANSPSGKERSSPPASPEQKDGSSLFVGQRSQIA